MATSGVRSHTWVLPCMEHDACRRVPQEEEFQMTCCPDARRGGDCSEEGLSSCSSGMGEVRPGQRRKGLYSLECVLNYVRAEREGK